MADSAAIPRHKSTKSVKSVHSIDLPGVPASQLGPILRAILQHNDQIVEQNQAILQLLQYHVDALPPPLPTEPTRPRSSSSATQVGLLQGDHKHNLLRPQSMWDEVLNASSKQSNNFVKDFHEWRRPASIREAFLSKNEWTSKSYQWSFPDLVNFLKKNEQSKKCHSQVSIRDFGKLSESAISSTYNEARPRVGLVRGTSVPSRNATSGGHLRTIRSVNAEDPFGCEILWKALGGCACHGHGQPFSMQQGSEISLCNRSINILDVSPKVLTCLLASTPRIDLSYLAAFVQRHLGSSNWGRATPLRYGDAMSSYTLEYHFSFYYVTTKYFEVGSVKADRRSQRKSAAFGTELATRSRYIHEESLSFLYIGHFKDVSTCVQLAESYFKYDPYHTKDFGSSDSSLFRPMNPDEPPSMLMLSWLSVALHHVLWRWQSAIDAVQAEIKSSREIVFMDDRNDLMADDPQFTLSKTYFWALQSYKLFEETISETVATWRRFQDESLPNLRDSRIPLIEWSKSVQDVDDAISELKRKLDIIKKRTEEVRELRKGLISASALFDSRTSVRQGENIRLLTYITILFLPLSFATSIFGMQFVGDGTSAVIAFAAVLPAITVVTALFVFNLHNMVDGWESLTDQISSWLQHGMKQHRRDGWQRTATELHEDAAELKAPVRKAKKRTSAWVYLLFILETAFVSFPVGELFRATCLFRGISSVGQDPATARLETGDESPIDPKVVEKIYESVAQEQQKERLKRREKIGPVLLALEDSWKAIPGVVRWTGTGILDVVRAVLLPIWSIMVFVEYCLLSLALLVGFISGRRSEESSAPRARKQHEEPSSFRRAFLVLGLDAVFPSRKKTRALTTVVPTPSPTRKKFTRAATQMSLHVKTPDPRQDLPVPLANPPPVSIAPPRPQESPGSASARFTLPPRPITLVSEASYSGHPTREGSRDTLDFIEAMSKTGTPRTPIFPHINGGSEPQSPRPPTGHTAHTAGTFEPHLSARSYTTDGITPLPEMLARAEPIRRMSAQAITGKAKDTATQKGLRISAIEQKPRTVIAEKDMQRRSQVPELDDGLDSESKASTRPPTPPRKSDPPTPIDFKREFERPKMPPIPTQKEASADKSETISLQSRPPSIPPEKHKGPAETISLPSRPPSPPPEPKTPASYKASARKSEVSLVISLQSRPPTPPPK